MAATTTVPETPPVVARPYRGGRLARILAPFRQAKGVQRFMLLTGTVLSFVFVFCAIFAPLIAPFDFDQYQDAAGRFPQQAAPSAAHHWGTHGQQLRRPVAHALGRAHGARGDGPRGRLRALHRRPARADLRLRRRLAGPDPRPRHGRAVRVPVPAAGDRDLVPAQGDDRQRHRRRGDRDHRRLRAAVLPGGESVRPCRRENPPTSRRRAPSARSRARSSTSTCSPTSSRACR